MLSVFRLDQHGGLEESSNLAQASEWIHGDTPVWVDAEALDDDDLVELLSNRMGFHELAVEDCIHRNQNPKIEEYPGYLFIVLHAVCASETTIFETAELHLFVGANYVVTVHDQPLAAASQLRAELRRQPSLLARGADWIMYLLFDRLVDAYLPLIDRFDEQLEAIEDEVFAQPRPSLLDKAFQLKKAIVRLRRISILQREIFLTLWRGSYSQIHRETALYLRDVYDHLGRLAEFAEGYRELVTGTLEVYLSAVGNRTNEIMKVLTIFSAILLPLNLVSSIYGMNFTHMPELHWKYGYPAVILLMLAITLGMLHYFRRKGWL